MKARRFLNYRLKYCWPKVICCLCQPNKLIWYITKETGGQTEANKKSGGSPLPRGGI